MFLSGVISYKSVLEQRKRWGFDEDKLNTVPPSRLYSEVKLCVFCYQFFEHFGGASDM